MQDKIARVGIDKSGSRGRKASRRALGVAVITQAERQVHTDTYLFYALEVVLHALHREVFPRDLTYVACLYVCVYAAHK